MSHQNLFCCHISKGIYTFDSSIKAKIYCYNFTKQPHFYPGMNTFWSKETIIRPPLQEFQNKVRIIQCKLCLLYGIPYNLQGNKIYVSTNVLEVYSLDMINVSGLQNETFVLTYLLLICKFGIVRYKIFNEFYIMWPRLNNFYTHKNLMSTILIIFLHIFDIFIRNLVTLDCTHHPILCG